MLTQDDLAILRAPFQAHEHKLLQGAVYLKEEAITNRLEDVDPSWSLDVNSIVWRTAKEGTEYCTAHVTLTVSGVSRDGIGQRTQEYSKKDIAYGQPEKGAVSDALKRAARLFGIGRYMLNAPKNMSDDQMVKWVNSLHGKGSKAAQRPAQHEPSAPAEQLYTVTLETVTRSRTKADTDYYRFDGGVFAFNRDAFRAAGMTECETWVDLPLDEPFALRAGVTAMVSQKAEGRYQVVSVQVATTQEDAPRNDTPKAHPLHGERLEIELIEAVRGRKGVGWEMDKWTASGKVVTGSGLETAFKLTVWPEDARKFADAGHVIEWPSSANNYAQFITHPNPTVIAEFRKSSGLCVRTVDENKPAYRKY